MQNCTKCKTPLPGHAKFCLQCGTPQSMQDANQGTAPFLDLNQDLSPQISKLFFKKLESTIQSEQNGQLLQTYSERIYTTGFRDILDTKIAQFSKEINLGTKKEAQVEVFITKELEQLVDIFIIHHCNDINKIKLPEKILKHQQTVPSKAIIFSIILDFLDFNNEKETVYLDFSSMSPKKFKNTTDAYLNPSNLEKILFICDQSLLGNGKSGFAMTDEGIYWKVPYKKPFSLKYKEIHTIQKTEDWITINGHFFNASPGLNLKMMRLLKKLSY